MAIRIYQWYILLFNTFIVALKSRVAIADHLCSFPELDLSKGDPRIDTLRTLTGLKPRAGRINFCRQLTAPGSCEPWIKLAHTIQAANRRCWQLAFLQCLAGDSKSRSNIRLADKVRANFAQFSPFSRMISGLVLK